MELVVLLAGLFLSLPLLVVLFFSQRHSGSSNSGKLPPGTMGWPVIGETFDFLVSAWRGNPEKFIKDRMNKHSPLVFKTCLFGESTAVLCDTVGNKFLFSNEINLVVPWWPSSVNKIFPTTNLSSSNKEAKKLRDLLILPGFFKPEALQHFVAVMDSMAKQHFELHWDNKQEVVVLPLSKKYTFTLASRLFLSIQDPNQVAKLAERFDDIAAGIISFPIDFPGTACNRAIKAVNVVRKVVLAIIKERKMELLEGCVSRGDMLSHMLVAKDENGELMMKDMEVADKTIGLLLGGHDTSSAAIISIVLYLAQLPHVYDKVFQEQMEIVKSKGEGELLNWDDIQKMKYSRNVISEALRLSPSVQGTFREALTDFNYAGFLIPKGWKLFWSPNSTHKNPKYFPDPEKFDPLRFEGSGPAPYSYVPFGGGPRMCPGKEYARLEILVFMHNLVRRFKWEKSIPHEKIVYNPLPTPQNGLPVRLYPH